MRKKKILLLSDDLRMHSGIATVSKDIVLGTMDHYEWVQIAGAVKHPDEGRLIDMNSAVRDETGIDHAYLKLYPVSELSLKSNCKLLSLITDIGGLIKENS